MSITADQRLRAMGLQRWQLRHPHYYPNVQQPTIHLPQDIALLFVSDETIDEHDAWLFGRILASMKLTPEQAMHVSTEGVAQLGEHQLTWIWYAGCESSEPSDVRVLRSIALSQMHQQPSAKKQLWQQICNYDK